LRSWRTVVGVAPEAKLMGLRLLAGLVTDEQNGQALGWQPPGATVHVSNNSWGKEDDGMTLGTNTGPTAMENLLLLAGMRRATTQNRGGLGTVIAISAGNGRTSDDDSSYDLFASSRFAMGVAAVNHDGKQSSYSSNGIDVAISAFGGEGGTQVWTTSLTGQGNQMNDYTDGFNGTSASAPQVSGAAALLLERNPNLGYRDVKEIRMKSAQKGVLTTDATPADCTKPPSKAPTDPF
jgi:subtilisin family serine protease